MVEAELGAPIHEIFSEFGEQPVAAASLAQVSALVHVSAAVVHLPDLSVGERCCILSSGTVASNKAAHATCLACGPGMQRCLC